MPSAPKPISGKELREQNRVRRAAMLERQAQEAREKADRAAKSLGGSRTAP